MSNAGCIVEVILIKGPFNAGKALLDPELSSRFLDPDYQRRVVADHERLKLEVVARLTEATSLIESAIRTLQEVLESTRQPARTVTARSPLAPNVEGAQESAEASAHTRPHMQPVSLFPKSSSKTRTPPDRYRPHLSVVEHQPVSPQLHIFKWNRPLRYPDTTSATYGPAERLR